VKYRLGDQPEAGNLQLGGQVPQFGGYSTFVNEVGGASTTRTGGSTQTAAATSGGGIAGSSGGSRSNRGDRPRTAIP